MSLTNEKINEKIDDIIISISKTVVSAGDDMTNDELALIVLKQQMQYLIDWYNEQLVEEINKMKISKSVREECLELDYYSNALEDVISKLKDQSLSDNK